MNEPGVSKRNCEDLATDDTQLLSNASRQGEPRTHVAALKSSTESKMTRQIAILFILALLAAPSTASAAVFDCSTALEETQQAANAIETRAVGRDQRCSVGRALLPLLQRQITIVAICEADPAKISLVKEVARRSKAYYQHVCGSEYPWTASEIF